MHSVGEWLAHATGQAVQPNPNAMTLSTVDSEGRPSARVVLCKLLVADPGYVVFYTNYQSRKCAEISANPHVSLVFHWDTLGRQARLEGIAVKSPAAESDAYFASRDRGSQIGAWGSDQSRPIESRDALLRQLESRAAEMGFAGDPDATIPRPPHWGGIRVWPFAVELWIEGSNRVHDRARWERRLQPVGDDTFSVSAWAGIRLQP